METLFPRTHLIIQRFARGPCVGSFQRLPRRDPLELGLFLGDDSLSW